MTAVLFAIWLLATPDDQTIEIWLRTGVITPAEAVDLLCADPSDKERDAFCSCPKEAIEQIQRRLNASEETS